MVIAIEILFVLLVVWVDYWPSFLPSFLPSLPNWFPPELKGLGFGL